MKRSYLDPDLYGRKNYHSARCEHHYCRCRRAAELAAMGRTLDAIKAHDESVLCRRPGDLS